MYKLYLEREVAVSHQLKKHDGKCANLHGHNLFIKVNIESEGLIQGGSSDGMVVDFGTVKKILDTLDHNHINSYAPTPELREQPTAERISEHLALTIYKASNNPLITKIEVSVEEARGQSASYTLDASKKVSN